MEFNELKQDVLNRAKESRACDSQYKRAYKSETKEELLQVIIDNIFWCYRSKMLDTIYMLNNFSELLEDFGIYATGNHEIENKSVILLGSSSATIETCGSSSATIKTFDNSSATIKTCGSSSATIETCGSSSATIKTCGSSSATIKTCGSSSATIKTFDNSSATIETCGSSSATIKTCDNSSATIKTCGSSSATYELKGDYSTIKDLIKMKLHVKKGKFEIVEI